MFNYAKKILIISLLISSPAQSLSLAPIATFFASRSKPVQIALGAVAYIGGLLLVSKCLKMQNQLASDVQIMSLLQERTDKNPTLIFSEDEEDTIETLAFAIKHKTKSSGFIFHGKPGCGKTATINEIAARSGAAVMHVNPSSLFRADLGGFFMPNPTVALESCFRIAKTYQKISGKPVIIFMDEIDLAGPIRTGITDGTMRVLAAKLLEQSQSATKQPGIYLAAATNCFDNIDEALLREERFGKHIELQSPEAPVVEKILNLYISGDNKPLVASALSLSKAAIVDGVREAAITTIRKSGNLKSEIQKETTSNHSLLQSLFSKPATTPTPPINLNDLKELVALIKDEDIAAFKENLSKIFKQKVEYKKKRESSKQEAALAA